MDIDSPHKRVDVVALRHLAAQIDRDRTAGIHLNTAAMSSIADIIRQAIGAPQAQATFEMGVEMADKLFSGSPSQRLAFNQGVAWAIFQLHSDSVRYCYKRDDATPSN